ncbi:MAG: lycopene cyclase family protein [Phyllobacteriaceae bacterium]|jgi:hypothetical protein|nr:lycopene cyclase family protein [Phyllobacteriaceae bacterium]
MVRNQVTICGAGISGLLMAAELSKSIRVVVLEKSEQANCSNKFWLTSKEALDANAEFRHCVDSHWNEMDFVAFDRSRFTTRGNYVLWDTKALEQHLIDAIAANGSAVLHGRRFYSYQVEENEIHAFANREKFTSDLLIDCMGFSSPLVSSSNAVSVLGYHHLYGKTMQLQKRIAPVAVDNVIVSGSPSYLEIFPKRDGSANVVLITSAKQAHTSETLKNDFEFIVNESHYADFFSKHENSQPLLGVVPIGVVKRRALDRVLFYGEAGQSHPAGSCTCLNRLLLGYKRAAANVLRCISDGTLGGRDLAETVPRMSRFAERFHQNLFRQFSTLTSHQGTSFIELMHCLDQKSLDDLIFGEIRPSHFVQIDNFRKIIKAKNTMWIRPLLRTMFS